MLTVLLLLLPLAGVLYADDDELPYYSALRTSDAPHIDGILDDECWAKAGKTVSFVAIGGKAVAVSTRGMSCWDGQSLYLAFICEEPLMKVIEERIAHGKMGGFEESVEIFLDADYDRSTYMQLRISITGDRESRKGTELCSDIHDGWPASVRRYEDKWIAEAAIPFKFLDEGCPHPDTVWGLNLNRQRLVGGEQGKYTCWSDTKGAFATPARFGNLVFADYALWLRQYFGKAIGGLTAEAADLMMHYPVAGKPMLEELNRLDGLWAEFVRMLPAIAPGDASELSGMIARGRAVAGRYEEFLARLRLAVIGTAFR